MIRYRICHSAYKDDISGTGAKLFGSRWNSKGVPMLYTAEHMSLAALEMLVHLFYTEIPVTFYLVSIYIPDNSSVTELKINKLKTGWQNDEGYSAFIGDEFIKSRETLYMKVPSAVVPEENNYLINPLHPDFKKVQITSTRQFAFDKRLLNI